MCKAYRTRLLLLLAALGALAGCARSPGDAAYVRKAPDPGSVAEGYALPGLDPHIPSATQGLAAHWARMPDGIEPGSASAVSAAPTERPVIRASVARAPEDQATAPAPAGKDTGATTRRSLYEKQPWEVELDKVVRGICHGC
jgi:hypothetical protein